MKKDKPSAAESLERDLSVLVPQSLDEKFAHRLDCCAAGEWATLTTEELCCEAAARKFQPAALSDAQLNRFAAVFDGVSFEESTKVAEFPGRTSLRHEPKHRRNWWSAAAAVALLGGSAAFFVPGKSSQLGAPISTAQKEMVPRPLQAEGFIPAGFDRDFSGMSDQGVIWSKDNRPHRVVKVGYTERVRLKKPDGRVYEVEQPREQYILVPVSGN